MADDKIKATMPVLCARLTAHLSSIRHLVVVGDEKYRVYILALPSSLPTPYWLPRKWVLRLLKWKFFAWLGKKLIRACTEVTGYVGLALRTLKGRRSDRHCRVGWRTRPALCIKIPACHHYKPYWQSLYSFMLYIQLVSLLGLRTVHIDGAIRYYITEMSSQFHP